MSVSVRGAEMKGSQEDELGKLVVGWAAVDRSLIVENLIVKVLGMNCN